MAIASGSASDPYHIVEFTEANGTFVASGVYDLDGRTAVSPYLNSGESTGVFIIVGESTAANHVNATYTATQSLNHNFCIYNGGAYLSKEPLLGSNISGGNTAPNTGHWGVKLADDLITDGKYARVIIVPVAIGGTLASDWANPNYPYPGSRVAVTANRLTTAGLTPTAILQILGANDTFFGTSHNTYLTNQQAAVQLWRTVGITCPFYISISSMAIGVTDAAIQTAQQDAVDHDKIRQGPNFDTIDVTFRYDTTHFNAAGRNKVANMWRSQIEAEL